jgi:hypothetical protein
MRMSIILPVVAALAAVVGFSSPAAATDLKGALNACNKHGGCQVHGTPGVGVNIKYGNNEIFCPYGGGKCECLMCAPPKRVGPAGGSTATGGVLVRDHRTPRASGGPTPATAIGKPILLQTTGQAVLHTKPRVAPPTRTTGTRGAGGGIVVR